MIKNTKANRQQYVKRATDMVRLYHKKQPLPTIKLQARNVDWQDSKIEGFIMVDNNLDVTEEEDKAWKEIEARNNDNVNHPEHYQSEEGIECIDAIKAALTPEEFRGYCKGNAIKYVWRERNKGGNESLRKANWYLNKVISND